jgi:hypothetical protein
MTAPSHRAGSTHGLVDQAWARRGSISSTARSDAGRREGKPRASTDQSAGKLGRSSVRKVVRKNPSRIVVVSLIPWRSSRPNPFLYRQQSRVERVGVRTRHDPFQRELRMQGIHENIPFAGSDHGRHPQCRQIVRLEPRIANCSTDRDPTPPTCRQRLGRQNEMVRDFHGTGIKRLNVIGLFEADENLQGGEGERLRHAANRGGSWGMTMMMTRWS